MKKLILLFFVIFLNGDVLELVKSVDEFKKVLEKRNNSVGNIYNPFVNIKKSVTTTNKQKNIKKSVNNKNIKKNVGYRLEVIFGDRVRINGNWYKIGDKIDDMVIHKIKSNSVVLKNNGKKSVLYFRTDTILKVSK